MPPPHKNMVAITQSQQVRQSGINSETNAAQPVRSSRATEEMTEIAAFQELAMATHMTRQQTNGGHRTLAQRMAASREHKSSITQFSEMEREEKADGGLKHVNSEAQSSAATATRGQFEQAEMTQLKQRLERGGGGPSSEADLAELKRRHAESIHGGLDVEALLHDSSGSGRRHLSDDSALITGFKFDSKGDSIKPLALLDHLERQFGKDRVDVALLDVKKAVAVEARSRSREGPGPQSWRSFSLGSAYHALISSRAIGVDMRSRISGLGIQPKGSEAETSRLMLKAPSLDERTVEPFVAKLVDMDTVSPGKKAAVYRTVRSAVTELPTTMWPLDALSQRQLALSKLDELSLHRPSHACGGSSLQSRTESRERTRLVKLIQ